MGAVHCGGPKQRIPAWSGGARQRRSDDGSAEIRCWRRTARIARLKVGNFEIDSLTEFQVQSVCFRDCHPYTSTLSRSPKLSSVAVPGSGTAPPPVVASQPPVSLIDTVFASIVTAPFYAKALPQVMLASVFKVMLVSARMLPANSVRVPRVAELPTCQKTSPP